MGIVAFWVRPSLLADRFRTISVASSRAYMRYVSTFKTLSRQDESILIGTFYAH